MRSITRFISNRLKLKVNEQKSAVARPAERKFLGFSISKEERGGSLRRNPFFVKQKIQELTSRTKGSVSSRWRRN